MFERSLGPLRLSVEHRAPGSEGGPTLRVLAGGRELLRFDCFARGAHWHLDPGGRDEIAELGPELDALEWTLAELRRDLPGYVARAGGPALAAPPAELAAALEGAERALRNPPFDFDAVQPALKRSSRGEKWTSYPPDALPLWVADMDFAVAEPIRRVLQRAVDTSDLGYPIHPAPTDLPEVFAARARARFGCEVEPRRVEILTDVVQGMYVGIDRLSAPGDGVVVQTPIYPPFLRAVAGDRAAACARARSRPGRPAAELDLDAAPPRRRGRARSCCSATRTTRRAASSGAPSSRRWPRCVARERSRRALGRDPRRPRALGRALRALRLARPGARGAHHHADLAPRRPSTSRGSAPPSRSSGATSSAAASSRCHATCAAASTSSASRRRARRGSTAAPGSTPRSTTCAGTASSSRASRARRSRASSTTPARPPIWRGSTAGRSSSAPRPGASSSTGPGSALSDGPTFGAPGAGFVRLNFATSRALLSEALERMSKALAAR